VAEPSGIRNSLNGHVKAAVRAAPTHGYEPFLTAAREAAALLVDEAPPFEPAVSWGELHAGAVDWVALLAEAQAQPGWTHVGAAALLHGAAAGLLEPFLQPGDDGVEAAALSRASWSPEATKAFVSFGLAAGWFEARDGRLFGEEIRAVAGFGTIHRPGDWLRRRLQFELDWFWSPIGGLAAAVRTGVAPAQFAASGVSGPFRAASAAMNLEAVALRVPAARAVARHLQLAERPTTILELGTGTGMWSRAFASHPRSVVTTVDHAEVGAVVRPAMDAEFAARCSWVESDPSTVPDVGPFDVVVVPELLHTLPPEAVPGFVRSAASVLGHGGVLVVVDPLMNSARRAPAGWLWMQVKLAVSGGGRVWDTTALRAVLLGAGLAPQPPRTVGGTQIMFAHKQT
jgi:hypothetical protein